jgi:hypothetical protein
MNTIALANKFKQKLETEILKSKNTIKNSNNTEEKLRAGIVMVMALYYHLLSDGGFDPLAFPAFIKENEEINLIKELLKEKKVGVKL